MDLEHVSAQAARSIIVLATADSADQSDARVLRVVLSVMAMHDRLKRENRGGLQVGGVHAVGAFALCDLHYKQLVCLGVPSVHDLYWPLSPCRGTLWQRYAT